jgi:hypothetical protein
MKPSGFDTTVTVSEAENYRKTVLRSVRSVDRLVRFYDDNPYRAAYPSVFVDTREFIQLVNEFSVVAKSDDANAKSQTLQ